MDWIKTVDPLLAGAWMVLIGILIWLYATSPNYRRLNGRKRSKKVAGETSSTGGSKKKRREVRRM